MNYIEKIRASIQKDLNEHVFTKGDCEESISPSGEFRLTATNYWCKDTNRDITKIEIYTGDEKIFSFCINDGRFFYSWLVKENNEWLICAEDIFGGQTLVDLKNRKMAGYSPDEDGFIWTDFHLSPHGNLLATIGCYWACPYVIKLFDFSTPLNLPLKEIKEFELLDNDEIILGWVNNQTLQLKGIQREREREYDENGSFSMKILKETKVERQIHINQA
jgi:hypothetical protein